MKLVLISPETFEPRESAVLGELFVRGLERYHVRKPRASIAELERWLRAMPEAWRPRLVLHQHHELTDTLGIGGRHWRDEGRPDETPSASGFTSRSCHDLATLRQTLGRTDAAFFGPVFSSLSKPGHGAMRNFDAAELRALLENRTAAQRRTEVIALGGVTAANIADCSQLGFDGIAVLGAVWQAVDPVQAFEAIQQACDERGRMRKPRMAVGASSPRLRGPRTTATT
jgi:thiamine-phosphate pyrophosphorylase